MNFPEPNRTVAPGEIIALAAMTVAIFVLCVLTFNSLGEDAFISFRYTRHLVAGHGLVFNPGEWVEGYSNLFWVLILVPFEMLGIRLHVGARFLSATFHAAAVVIAWWLGRRLLPRDTPGILLWWLPLAIFFEPLLHYHTDRGLETVAWVTLQFFALAALAGGRGPLVAGAFAALTVWTRPEGIGFALALAPAAAWSANPSRIIPRPDMATVRRVLQYLALPILFFIAQMIFRKLAYGSLLPNTVVAKSGGMFASVREMAEFVCSHAFWPLLGVPGLLWAFLQPRLRVLAVGALGLILAAITFRLMAGDLQNTGFRYLLPVMLPSLVGYWLLMTQTALSLTRHAREGSVTRRFILPAACVTLLFPVVHMPVVLEPGSFFRGNTNAPRGRLLNRLFERETWNATERLNWFLSDPVYINTDAGLWVARNLPPDAPIGADQVGQFSFHTAPGQPVIDMLGLTNSHIARHGASAEYLLSRGVNYLVIETRLDIQEWPRAWRLRPSVPILRDVFAREDFQSAYRPRWLLRSPVSYIGVGFMVYVSQAADDGLPLEEVLVGLPEEQFERLWRVK